MTKYFVDENFDSIPEVVEMTLSTFRKNKLNGDYKVDAIISFGEPYINGHYVYQLPHYISNALNLGGEVITFHFSRVSDPNLIKILVSSVFTSYECSNLLCVKCEKYHWDIELLEEARIHSYSNLNSNEVNVGISNVECKYGSTTLSKSDILSTKSLSLENQNLIWPIEEGFPYIPKFKDSNEVMKLVYTTFDEITSGVGDRGIIFYTYNGRDFDTFGRMKRLEKDFPNHDIVFYEGSCFGSLLALKLLETLVSDNIYDFGGYVSLSDRARFFNRDTPLFSINYGDAIGYARVDKSPKYLVEKISAISDSELILKDHISYIGNRESYKLKKRFSDMESKGIIKTTQYLNSLPNKSNVKHILPRMSPAAFEIVNKSNNFRHSTWAKHSLYPTGIFSGLNWIAEFSEVFESDDYVSVSTIGFGFSWVSALLKVV
ncbi:hypothetical protein AB6D60_22415 [Vibrio splendidus]